MFTERWSATDLARAFAGHRRRPAFPTAADRTAWDGLLAHPLNRARRAALLARAEAHLGQPWPELPASLYLDHFRTGNRSRYETPYFARRSRLADLVLAECWDGRGRFLDAAMDGLWLIAEESTWVIPAHRHHGLAEDRRHCLPEAAAVPDPDLFACETAAVLAQTLELLGPQLAAITPALPGRIRHEIRRQVVEPVMDFPAGYFWLNGRNNWTPWCSQNTLIAAMQVVDDDAALGALARQLVDACERFVANYGEDGGCDEGAMYWSVAGGALLWFLEELHHRSGGFAACWDEPKLRAIGRFPWRTWMGEGWFPTFADARARGLPGRTTLWRWGERAEDPGMRRLAWLSARGGREQGGFDELLGPGGCGNRLTQQVRELWWVPAAALDGPMPEAAAAEDDWLPDLQVLVARERTVEGAGLVLAAKAGHNDENHNHNDVGQFIVALDGRPLVVDVGIGDYTAETFSARRYGIWCIRGSGHNPPLVNGAEQGPGRQQAARAVGFARDGAVSRLAMDLAACYPAEARLASLQRELVLDRAAGRVEVADRMRCTAGPVAAEIALTCAVAPRLDGDGALLAPAAGRALRLRWDAGLQASVEPIRLDDPVLAAAWGSLWRLVLRGHAVGSELAWRITLAPEGV